MFGIGGYQQRLLYQDGIYTGLLVVSASGLNVNVGTGIGIVAGKATEQTPANVSTNILLPAGATTNVYFNAAGAVDGSGNALAEFGITPEANQTYTNINGTVGTLFGRSMVLAACAVSANSATVTIAGTWAAADVLNVTINSTLVSITLTTPQAASVTTVAAAMVAAIEATPALSSLVVANNLAGVITITALTSGTVSAYSLTTTKTSTSGTTVASAGNLGGAAITKVDNTARLLPINIPAATLTSNIDKYTLISY